MCDSVPEEEQELLCPFQVSTRAEISHSEQMFTPQEPLFWVGKALPEVFLRDGCLSSEQENAG